MKILFVVDIYKTSLTTTTFGKFPSLYLWTQYLPYLSLTKVFHYTIKQMQDCCSRAVHYRNKPHHSQEKLIFVPQISQNGHFKISYFCDLEFPVRIRTPYHRRQISKYA